ncbi:hypothetical protein LB505_006221 [Fusarium chuoi]|nr:hypothetical protein LB505_006221 [Fusarium chuoi]
MFSPLLLLTLTFSVLATPPPSLNTTSLSQHHPSRIAPRFISGGFYDKCKDVRFYLAKADDTHPRKNSFTGYKSSPWLVAKYVAVGAVDGYLTCHGNWGILDYCSGRPSHDPFLDSK